MKKIIVFSVIFFLSLGVFSSAQDKPKEVHKKDIQQSENAKQEEMRKPWNAVCPVKGNPVEEDVPTVNYNGKVYGFCCPGCDSKFAKNPEKYSKNLSEDGKKFIGKK